MISDAATSSQPEDIFVDIFSQVFGFEKAQLLVPELDFQDFIGGSRRIDYALKTTDGRVAFEIDGPLHYHPDNGTAWADEMPACGNGINISGLIRGAVRGRSHSI